MHEKNCKQPIFTHPEVETRHLRYYVRQAYEDKYYFMAEAKQEILWGEK